MTLVVVLLFGLGTVLILSAIETDPKTGKSVSVIQVIQDVWNNKVDFSQPGSSSSDSSGSSSGGGLFTAQNAATAIYMQHRQV